MIPQIWTPLMLLVVLNPPTMDWLDFGKINLVIITMQLLGIVPQVQGLLTKQHLLADALPFTLMVST